MDTNVKLILIFSLMALSAALLEALVLSRIRPGTYNWREYWATLGIAAGRRLTDLVPLALALPGGQWLYEHRLLDFDPYSWQGLLGLFFGVEFCYYWYHRANHRVRWLWATHSVHHSSNQMNLSTAYRLGWTGKVSLGLAFFLPLCGLGFPPSLVIAAFSINLLYQFWVHNDWVPPLGFLEGILNTPSAHRVHHAANLEYLDTNYGGVLMIFDRMFGTYVVERPGVPIRYGLVDPLLTHNPFKIAFHHWFMLWKDLKTSRSWKVWILYLIKPPGWSPTGSGLTTEELRTGLVQNILIKAPTKTHTETLTELQQLAPTTKPT